MLTYIETKMVDGTRMTRGAYNTYRGWTLPADEVGTDPGYLIEYRNDVGDPKLPGKQDYVTWVPADVFEATYAAVNDAISFGEAIYLLKRGHRVSRAGWNGKGMWLYLVPAGDSQLRDGAEYEALPFIVMKTADNKIVPWLASQTDVLAEDWSIVA